jgi:hypothetical protein
MKKIATFFTSKKKKNPQIRWPHVVPGIKPRNIPEPYSLPLIHITRMFPTMIHITSGPGRPNVELANDHMSHLRKKPLN